MIQEGQSDDEVPSAFGDFNVSLTDRYAVVPNQSIAINFTRVKSG